MVRQKNAKTQYFVADIPEDNAEPDWKRLAKWLSTVNDDSEEETEDQGFYDGDGTPETDVTSIKKTYSFEGFMDYDDPAHQFIASKEFETGEGRKIMFKQVRTNGDALTGKATLTEVKVTGGEATEYTPLSFTISWDSKPEITKATP